MKSSLGQHCPGVTGCMAARDAEPLHLHLGSEACINMNPFALQLQIPACHVPSPAAPRLHLGYWQ